MTRSEQRLELAVQRTLGSVFGTVQFRLAGAATEYTGNLGQGSTETKLRGGGGGHTKEQRRTLVVRRSALPVKPVSGKSLTIIAPAEVWEIGTVSSDAVLWTIELRAPRKT